MYGSQKHRKKKETLSHTKNEEKEHSWIFAMLKTFQESPEIYNHNFSNCLDDMRLMFGAGLDTTTTTLSISAFCFFWLELSFLFSFCAGHIRIWPENKSIFETVRKTSLPRCLVWRKKKKDNS